MKMADMEMMEMMEMMEDEKNVPEFDRIMWIGGDERGYSMEFVQNTLYSVRLQTMFVWFPKCMCSTVRDLFLQIQYILNPNLVNEPFNTNIHQLHRRQRFRYISPLRTPLHHMFIIIRDPIHRLISTFFDKHILKRQWHYLNLHHYRKFRLWLDIESLPHTFVTYIRFLTEHHYIDVHDCPAVFQMPFHLWKEDHATTTRDMYIFSMEDPQWVQKFENCISKILKTEKVIEKRRRSILTLVHDYMHKIRRNEIPRCPAHQTYPCLDINMMHRNTSWWVHHARQYGFPSNKDVVRCIDPACLAQIKNICLADTLFHQRLLACHKSSAKSLKLPPSSTPNIWLHQKNTPPHDLTNCKMINITKNG